MPSRTGLERLIALGYGWTYGAIVRRFQPHVALLDEIAALVKRSANGARTPSATSVLDVSCGIGTVAARLARDGYSVVGCDAVEHLVSVARAATPAGVQGPTFHHLDVARDPVPGAGTYDVIVSAHTLYWHPDPNGVLAGCRRALRPGGHAIFLTYARPAHVVSTCRAVWQREGMVAGVRALRWLIPTALFERFRECDHRYFSRDDFLGKLTQAGFEVIESRTTFLDDLSLLAWARTQGMSAGPRSDVHARQEVP